MNYISKAFTRFYEWMYHPAFRYYKLTRAVTYRTPSPGSQFRQIHLHNHKQPFIYSFYNVRFRRPTYHQKKLPISIFAMDAINRPSVPEKLIDANLLKKEDENNKEAIETAKTKWFKKYKVPVQQAVHNNDFGWKIPEFDNPQTFRYLLDMRTKVNNYQLKILRGIDNYDRIYNTKQIHIEYMDFFSGDPEFQQTLLEVRYWMDNHEKQAIERGQIPIYSSSRNFWKALDDINDRDNVLRVETHIGDPYPLDFSLGPKNEPKKFIIEKKDGKVHLSSS